MVDRVKHDLWEILHYISWITKISSQVRIIRTDSFVVAVVVIVVASNVGG